MERFTEHRASSFHDAGLWRKLLEKAKKGTTTESFFAADIVNGSLQTSMFAKLGLPAEFLEHHRKNLTENIILEGPDGHKWPVMLGQSWDCKPCLLHGWREFATDCNLAVNDKILFFLWEDSHFLVQVFDSNHNIKCRGGGTSAPIARTALPQGGTSARVARTPLPQVTEPIQSFGSKTTRSNVVSLGPSRNNNSGVAKNVHKENHTTRASPLGEKLGNQEPAGVEEDIDPVVDFDADFAKLLESFPDPESSPPSDAEEDQGLSMERARNMNRKSKGRGGGRFHKSSTDRLGSSLTIADFMKQSEALAQQADEGKMANLGGEEKIPKKRARQAPMDRSKAGSASPFRKRQTRAMKTTLPDDPESRATMSDPDNSIKLKPGRWCRREAEDEAREAENSAAKAAANKGAEKAKAAKEAASKGGEATAPVPAAPAPASDPVTPLSVESPKQTTFKRPKPRIPSASSQLYFSKRRPVTHQEREAALEAGQQYAVESYNRTHVMQLRVTQVYCGFRLAVTPDFAEAMELPMEGLQKVTLFDETGRFWQAEWHGDHPKRSGLSSDGWTHFALDHCLEEGDVCVFELPDPKVSNIAVKVFRVVPLPETPRPYMWRDHYTLEEQRPVVPPVVPAVVPPEAPSDFGLDLAASQSVGQPSSFGKEDSGMKEKQRMLSIDHDKSLGEEEMNKSFEKEKSCMEEKSCTEEKNTRGKSREKSFEEIRFKEQFFLEAIIMEDNICKEENVEEDFT